MQYSNPFAEGQYPSPIAGLRRSYEAFAADTARRRAEEGDQRQQMMMFAAKLMIARKEEEEQRRYQEAQEAEERKYREGRAEVKFGRQKILKGMSTGAVAQRQGPYNEWSIGNLNRERDRVKDADAYMDIQRAIKTKTGNEKIIISEFAAMPVYSIVLKKMKEGDFNKDEAKEYIFSKGFTMKQHPFNQLLTKKTLDELIAEIIKPILKERQGAQ